MADSGGRDFFFISYTSVNRPWAEWIAVQSEQAGYSTVLQAWVSRYELLRAYPKQHLRVVYRQVEDPAS